jgi:archaetidylinositol phosphate synthase
LPDDLTIVGVAAALGICAAYQLSNDATGWLWVASGLLVIQLSIATLIVVAYLILSINVYLESYAFGRFALGYGRIGPTEVRIVLIALNTALALGLGLDFNLVDLDLTVFDLIGLGIAAVMIVLLAGRAMHNLRLLAREEPAARRQ